MSKKDRTLLIDDLRELEADSVARNYWEGILELEGNGPWDLLLLDHDLASFDDEGKEWTGTDVMNWLEANPQHLPAAIIFVTSNPVGRDRMERIRQRLYKV